MAPVPVPPVVRTLADHLALANALRDPACWPHDWCVAAPVELIETHISSVLLAGSWALKLKKPVDLGFLDFTGLAARHHYCAEELRINRRTAPQLYCAVVPIGGTLRAPRVGAAGAAIDWAVQMHRFDNDLLLDRLARRGQLGEPHADALAAAVARLHGQAQPVARASPLGSPAVVARWMRANLADLRRQEHSAANRALLDRLAAWTESEMARRADLIAARHAGGWVRECHGDLHLGNVVLLAGSPVLFDAIEFNCELRSIDVINDAAFAWMDLLDHGLPQLATRFLSGYLESTGDYDGLPLLRLYAVQRALVRARVAQVRAQQCGAAAAVRVEAQQGVAHHLALAQTLARPAALRVVVMHGCSGAGKSTVALLLAQRLGAVRVRSDVERKRLSGLAPTAASQGAIYSAQATRQTYARLQQVVQAALDGGFSVVVDAASLKHAERAALRATAARHGAPATIVSCHAPEVVLRARLRARAAVGADPSEATETVLQQQLAWNEPLTADELPFAQVIDTDVAPAALAQRVQVLAAALGADDAGGAAAGADPG